MVNSPSFVGPGDWQLYSSYLETSRKTIQEFGQFPWWNPYSAGGYPFFANPITFGAFSHPVLLSLIFGTLTGLKLSVIFASLFGLVGMYFLAGTVTQNRLYRVGAAIVFSCNGGIAIHFSIGHMFWDYFFFPWIIYFVHQINGSPRSIKAVNLSVLCGVFLGLSVQSAIHYGFVYQMLTVFGFFLYGAWTVRKNTEERNALLRVYFIIVLGLVAVGGSRLLISLQLMRDFPRVQKWETEAGLERLLRIFFEPGQSIFTLGGSPLGWWEWGCYLGGLSAALFLISLPGRLRYFHLAFLIGLVFFYSSFSPWPYYWLNAYVPLFKSMRLAPRLRIWLVPFFALGFAQGLERVQERFKWLPSALVLFTAFDICLNSFFTIHSAFMDKTENYLSDQWPKNSKVYPATYQDKLGKGSGLFLSLTQNFAHTPGYEPALSPILWAKSVEDLPIKGFNSKEYRGEFYTEKGPIEPIFWSPNKLVFEGVSGKLHLNMNLGSYWYVNGQPVFSKYKVSEIETHLTVEPDAHGRITLEVKPKGFWSMIIICSAALILGLVLIWDSWKKARLFSSSSLLVRGLTPG